MKSWEETRRVFEEIRRLAAAGRTSVLATLVRVEGSHYRRPGAKLLIRDDGTVLGNISGGCLEEDLRERARKVMASGKPELVHYETGADENVVWGLGLGCNGKIDIHLEPAPADRAEDLLRKLDGNEPFQFRAGDFAETLTPPPLLIICGAGDDSIPLVRLAVDAGFRVTLVDHRSAYLRPELFAGARLAHVRPEQGIAVDKNTFAIVKNHALELDRAWTHFFAKSPARYIGLLGPKARRDEILKSQISNLKSRLHAPTGLDLDAEGPDQIAVSIVAELLAIAAGRKPQHLRDRKAPIHES